VGHNLALPPNIYKNMDTDAPSRRSLWRDLSDGTAGTGVRILIAIALFIFLLGAGLILTYALAALIPAWDRTTYYRTFAGQGRTVMIAQGVRPTEGLMLVVLLLMAAVWIAAVIWLFIGRARNKSMLRPMLISIGIIALTICLSVAADSTLAGDEEIVIGGIVLLGIAGIVMLWLLAFRAARVGRPLQNAQDKQLDIRCPDCGYRMVGLMETRCPECGTAYTLDQLLSKQNFEKPAAQRSPIEPPPLPQQTTPV